MRNEEMSQISNPVGEVQERKKLTPEERAAIKKKKERIRKAAEAKGLTEEEYLAARRKKRKGAIKKEEAVTEAELVVEEEVVEIEAEPVAEEEVVEIEAEPVAEEEVVEIEAEPVVEEEVVEIEAEPVVEIEELNVLIEEEKNQEKKIFSSASEEEIIRIDEMEQNELVEFMGVCKNIVWMGLSNSIEARKKEIESKYETRSLFLIIFIAVAFVTTTIHIPLLQSMLNILDRMKIAGILVIIVLSVFLILTGIVYVYAKQINQEIKYQDVSSVYSIAFIPGIFLFTLAFFASYLSVVVALLIIIANLMYWILLSSQITTYLLKDNILKSNLIMLFVSMLIFLTLYFAIKLSAMGAIASVMNSGVEVVQSSDGSVTGSFQAIIQAIINFLRDIDALFE